jgi:ABC-type antimicrobial peptide transport system permease subunit
MSALLTPTTAAAVLFGVAVLIAVIAAVLPRCPARRRDALKVLEVLVRRRPRL